ncbi:acid phosphatase 1-like [Cucurbita pepo subsp. pepo]|uniref:acid phosphatase 1-like n=1 Tax=Cucurbita pepo subsp. pepo TaxID=3664 RepID=UPI000C9D48E7|nr:acid phosphatase 1-like [Cucurbita pepo subsp. pepo]XP_023538945.1 acid phosphatase 1-like [Cucurbita pepo subsp. pepo]
MVMAMAKSVLPLLFTFFCLFIALTAADWNIINRRTNNGLKISLKNYCESWRLNVELHNVRYFKLVPEECVGYIGNYVTSTQYKVDSERTIEECIVYLTKGCSLKGDGTDAWIFDIDDTLISTVPYYKKAQYGGKKLNITDLEAWMSEAKAPVLGHTLRFFNLLKAKGVDIILISARREALRSATIENLVQKGYHGWSDLFFRSDEEKDVEKYKSDVRRRLVKGGYCIWGILGDQYSSLEGTPSGRRTFKLPNPMYYVA